MQIAISVSARSSGLTLYGEAYRVPSDPNADDVLVKPVHASNGNDFGLVLDPASYILKFHVTAGAGAYRVSILDGAGHVLAFGDFDTKNGYTGKSVPFEVP